MLNFKFQNKYIVIHCRNLLSPLYRLQNLTKLGSIFLDAKKRTFQYRMKRYPNIKDKAKSILCESLLKEIKE